MMRSRLVVLAMLVGLIAGALPATAQEAEEPQPGFFPSPGEAAPDLDELDPVRFEYGDAVVEHAQVTTRTGAQIWLDVIRPPTDEPVPAIMMSSPYYNTLGRGWRAQLKTPHQGPSFPTSPGAPFLSGDEQTGFPEWYDEYFVPRGYAYVAMDLRGTRNSSGCQVYGDRDEVFDAVDVIDWIADQDWSSGKVGMTGGSYDGTIAIGAAAEQPISGRHPDALAAIIPIRAIDRWYDYHFFNGVQSSGHAATPALFTAALAGADTQNSGTDDVLLPLHFVERKACIATVGAAVDAGYASPYQNADDPFWVERDFTKDAAGMRAATFLIHGLFDFNVKTNNLGHLWEALPEDLPTRLWLFNGSHLDPHAPTIDDGAGPFPFQERFVEATHRWYLQFLKGVEAGATAGPEVEVQQADGRFLDGGSYPAPSSDLTLSLTTDGSAVEGDAAEEGSVAYADGPTSSAPSSVTFVTEPLEEATRLSGQIAFDLDVAIEGPDTSVAVEILDVPPDVDPQADATETMDGAEAAPLRIGYAWARAWYRDSIPLRGLSTPTGGGPVTSSDPFELRFGSLYTDVLIGAGHRLAFTFSNSAGGTVAAELGQTVTLDTGPDASRVLLPVADPYAAEEPQPPPIEDPDPPELPDPPGDPDPPTVERHGGADRVATAAAVSAAAYDESTTVVVATREDYADALTGAPLATHLEAPLLLTARTALDDDAADEIERLGATQAVLLGGEVALSDQVETDLEALGLTVRRVAGATRFSTAAAIASELPASDEVLVAEGLHADPARGWPDALSASGLAASVVRPVLLVTHADLPEDTARALSASTDVTIVGGPAAVSEAVAERIDERAGTVERVSGADRYETSVAAADLGERLGVDPAVTWLATGHDWPDGLAAAAAAGADRGALLLIDGRDLDASPGPERWLRDHADQLRAVHLAGGPAAISAAVEERLRQTVANVDPPAD